MYKQCPPLSWTGNKIRIQCYESDGRHTKQQVETKHLKGGVKGNVSVDFYYTFCGKVTQQNPLFVSKLESKQHS